MPEKDFLLEVLNTLSRLIDIADSNSDNLDTDDIKAIGRAEYITEKFRAYITAKMQEKENLPTAYDVVKGSSFTQDKNIVNEY